MSIAKRSEMYLPTFWDNFFSRYLTDWGSNNFSSTDTTLPAVNVKETDERFDIEVAAPGMNREYFRVNLVNNVLTISSERSEEKNEEKGANYTRSEFYYQSFQRSFTVPENLVECEKISARYSDGLLCVTLPKREELKTKPGRTIEIA